MKFRNKKKFRYGIPAYTGPFRALLVTSGINTYFIPELYMRTYILSVLLRYLNLLLLQVFTVTRNFNCQNPTSG
jgi:hypothetical protein